MTTDAGSLDRLHDIVVPDPIPWWPPAPGWLWLLAAVLVVAAALLLRAFRHHQQNRYRHEALRELDTLRRFDGAPDFNALAELLKRVALSAYPRATVADLSGPPWFEFLDRSGGTRFSEGPGRDLEQSNYGSATVQWTPESTERLFREIEHYIRKHVPATKLAATGDTQNPDRPQARAA